MPSTPPPLYLDSQINQLLQDRTIHEFDVLLNYAHTHGTYLLNDTQFRIFQITYETSKVLNSTLRQLYPSTDPQTINAAMRLHALQQTHSRQARITYDRIIIPEDPVNNDSVTYVNSPHIRNETAQITGVKPVTTLLRDT